MKKVMSLPLKRTVSRTEHVAFRVEPDIKKKLLLLSRKGVNVADCLRDNTADWLERVEKEYTVDFKEAEKD